jgi:hypothetical protein
MFYVQQGEHICRIIVQEDDYHAKVDKVVETLSVSDPVISYVDKSTNIGCSSTSWFAEA